MLRNQIEKDLKEAIIRLAQSKKKLVLEGGRGRELLPKGLIVRSSDKKFGDFSTNVALQLAQGKPSKDREFKQSPMDFAKLLAGSLKDLPYVKKLEVKEPGFLNFFIKDNIWQKQVQEVLAKKEKYGSNNLGSGKKARVEFVSANPTGPLHFGNARGGPIGDTLASVLAFCGYKVWREYIHNDIGGQVAKLGQSLVNVLAGVKLEDQEYKGEYIQELAGLLKSKVKSEKLKEDVEEMGRRAVGILLDEILADCAKLGIKFDKVYAESQFAATGATEKVLKALGTKGVLREKEGAVWFAPSDEFLRDRETVVTKSDGTYTYFANDIAYHNLKFAEGYDLVIDVFGANHHGHVPRLQAVISALGYDVARFHVILYQWVRFKRGGRVVAMSKRSGNFVTTREVLGEVGRDALRFFILMHDEASHIDFDLDLARKKSKENPVYYVQYAHARIASILKKTGPVSSFPASPAGRPPASAEASAGKPASDVSAAVPLEAKRSGVGSPSHSSLSGSTERSPSNVLRAHPSESKTTTATRFNLLSTNYELDLIKQITRLPELVEDIAEGFAVHRLTSFAIELADSFHKFYENCRVLSTGRQDLGEDEELSKARLELCLATKIALENTLGLLGVSAPEKM